jgi:hypothetical protein
VSTRSTTPPAVFARLAPVSHPTTRRIVSAACPDVAALVEADVADQPAASVGAEELLQHGCAGAVRAGDGVEQCLRGLSRVDRVLLDVEAGLGAGEARGEVGAARRQLRAVTPADAYTTPIPPRPSIATIRYRPYFEPTAMSGSVDIDSRGSEGRLSRTAWSRVTASAPSSG